MDNIETCRRLANLATEGLRLKNEGKTVEAIDCFERVLREDPIWDHGTAAQELAQCYQSLGDLVTARKYYENALTQWPDYDIFVHNYAIFLAKNGSPSEALPYLRRALANERSSAKPSCIEWFETLIKNAGCEAGLSPREIEDLLQVST